MQMLSRGRRKYYREFWALHPMDLQISHGETVGIVGTNGSGKSTLLQLITGSLTPTSGNVQVRGKIAALLELGTGFNPEFTGRENVYVNSAVLGRTEAETKARFAEIESFADIGEFIDRPVKTYSSGMFARLAFAVAIHVDPDVLVVDEILAVGDASFARKCFARIEELKRGGGTILFVSHNTSQVLEFCDRAILLDRGRHLVTGPTRITVSLYQKLAFAPPQRRTEVLAEIEQELAKGSKPESVAGEHVAHDAAQPTQPPSPNEAAHAIPISAKETSAELNLKASFDPGLKPSTTVRYASDGAEISNVRIETLDAEQVNCLICGETYRFIYQVRFTRDCVGVRCYTLIRSLTGLELGGGTIPEVNGREPSFACDQTIECTFEFDCRLGPETYFVNCGVGEAGGSALDRIIDVLMFRVMPRTPTNSFGNVDFGYRGSISLIR